MIFLIRIFLSTDLIFLSLYDKTSSIQNLLLLRSYLVNKHLTRRFAVPLVTLVMQVVKVLLSSVLPESRAEMVVER